jgi:hypothetical protein
LQKIGVKIIGMLMAYFASQGEALDRIRLAFGELGLLLAYYNYKNVVLA